MYSNVRTFTQIKSKTYKTGNQTNENNSGDEDNWQKMFYLILFAQGHKWNIRIYKIQA